MISALLKPVLMFRSHASFPEPKAWSSVPWSTPSPTDLGSKLGGNKRHGKSIMRSCRRVGQTRVAVDELKLSFHKEETLVFSIYPFHDNVN